MEWMICLGAGGVCLIVAMALVKKFNLVGWIFFVFGLMSIGLSMYSLHIKAPNGLPVELKADGLYEVRVVDVYTEKNKEWIAVQVLEEQGNTITGLKPFRKISKAKFGNNNIVIGIPMIIELETISSQQYLAVK